VDQTQPILRQEAAVRVGYYLEHLQPIRLSLTQLQLALAALDKRVLTP
jgi:hypothetical protein